MNRREMQQIAQNLATKGAAILPLQTEEQPKATYYTPDGRAMVLPADPVSLRRYRNIGFTLTPPPAPEKNNRRAQ